MSVQDGEHLPNGSPHVAHQSFCLAEGGGMGMRNTAGVDGGWEQIPLEAVPGHIGVGSQDVWGLRPHLPSEGSPQQ